MFKSSENAVDPFTSGISIKNLPITKIIHKTEEQALLYILKIRGYVVCLVYDRLTYPASAKALYFDTVFGIKVLT